MAAQSTSLGTSSTTQEVQAPMFRAAWPCESTCTKVTQFILSALSWVFFPLKAIAWLWNRYAVVPVIYPIIARPEGRIDRRCRETFSEYYRGERVQFRSSDGTKLDGMFFQGRRPDRVILFCQGNDRAYERIGSDRLEFFKDTLGASVFLYNPRGVGQSKGFPSSSRELALDHFSAFEYLVHRKRIAPEHVLSWGWSLGGAAAASGAGFAQGKYKNRQIALVSERSFSDLRKVVEHHSSFQNPIMKFCTKIWLAFSSWQMKPKTAFDSLEGRKLLIYNRHDAAVPYEASLMRACEGNNGVTSVEMHDEIMSMGAHLRFFNEQEQLSIQNALL